MQKQEHRQEWTHKGDCIQEVVRVHTEKLERFSKSVTVPKLILPPRKRSQSMSGNDTSSNCSGVSEIHCKDDLFINFKIYNILIYYQLLRGFDRLLQMTIFNNIAWQSSFLVRFAGLVTSNDFFIPAPLSSTSHSCSGRWDTHHSPHMIPIPQLKCTRRANA